MTNLFRGSSSALAVERVSIFALGVSPILSALLVVQLARLASERFNDWAGATPNARRVDHYVLIGSLLFAALQGYGMATSLESAKNLVDEPGPQFQLNAVATFVAATALLVWLAALISRHGVGSIPHDAARSADVDRRPIDDGYRGSRFGHAGPVAMNAGLTESCL